VRVSKAVCVCVGHFFTILGLGAAVAYKLSAVVLDRKVLGVCLRLRGGVAFTAEGRRGAGATCAGNTGSGECRFGSDTGLIGRLCEGSQGTSSLVLGLVGLSWGLIIGDCARIGGETTVIAGDLALRGNEELPSTAAECGARVGGP
jgi:hypothetical protein